MTMCSESQTSHLQTPGRQSVVSSDPTRRCSFIHTAVGGDETRKGLLSGEAGGERTLAEVDGKVAEGVEGPGNRRRGAGRGNHTTQGYASPRPTQDYHIFSMWQMPVSTFIDLLLY